MKSYGAQTMDTGARCICPPESGGYARRDCRVCFWHGDTGTDRLPAGHCRKCRGTGTLPHFGHVQGGACFACKGTGRTR